MTFLLDVSVLIALIDQNHIAHAITHNWFAREGRTSWASCAITENGVLRIVGHSRYPSATTSPAAVAPILATVLAQGRHQFWAEDLSLMTSPIIDREMVKTSGQVTDTYLLALAVSRGGALATLDRRLSPRAVRGGAAALHLIPV